MENYWIKDLTRQKIITKNLIPNNGNFEFYATYFNLIDCKGLSFHFREKLKFNSGKLYNKNGYEYCLLQHENFFEFMVLPNENLKILIQKILLKINYCDNEDDVIDLVISQMN